MTRLLTFLLGAAAGAAAARLLSRREGGTGSLAATATAVAGKARGAVSSVTPGDRLSDPDDVTLARKVETEIFRPADAPKGAVSVDVQAGVVYLRGMVDDEEWIRRLGEEAGKVAGVKSVKNLLHRPGTPAPAAEPRGAVYER